jgi:sphingomyelin phosphodiesterase
MKLSTRIFILAFIVFTVSIQNGQCSLLDTIDPYLTLLTSGSKFVGQSSIVLKDLITQVKASSSIKEMRNVIHDILSPFPLCDVCTDLATDLRSVGMSNTTVKVLQTFAYELCDIAGLNKTVCLGAVLEFGPILIDNLVLREFDPTYVCGNINLCEKIVQEQSIETFIKQVLADKPKTPIPSPTGRSTYTVLQVADVHVDLEYAEGSNAFCNEPFCCRAENGMATNATDGALYWGTLSDCDIPFRTVEQMIQFVAENLNPDIVLWTGDNISHDVWHQSIATQTVNTYNITMAMQQGWPNYTIIPQFGNHECFPADQFDVFDNTTAWLTDRLSGIWSEWFDDPAAFESFTMYGYYSKEIAGKNLKVITLNTQACDAINFYLIRDPYDPLDQLEWFRQELYASEALNQSVWVIGHIPSGDFYCDSRWSARYKAVVDRFAHIIRGQFFGHTHNDQFEAQTSYIDGSPIGVAFIAPSLTTFSNLNPSFRIIEIDTDTNLPVNLYQYRLNLSYWNTNITGPLQWDLAYTQLEEYNMTDMSFQSFYNLGQQLAQNSTLLDLYNYNFNSGGIPFGPMETKAAKALYCQAQNAIFLDALKCVGVADLTASEIMFISMQYLQGNWIDYLEMGHAPQYDFEIVTE